jgi:uncharacterized membrane protein YccC
MSQLPRWVWLVAGLVLVAVLWETARPLAAVFVVLIVLYHLSVAGR